jgi:uncharacterized protein
MPLQGSPADRSGARLPRALEGRTVIARLLDIYAEMLTDHQRDLLRLYYHDDLSLGEIADRRGVTRQAVFDSLRRSVAELRHLEDRLRFLADRDRRARAREEVSARLRVAEEALTRLTDAGAADTESLARALRALREVV